jgi:hypothetical protein
MIARIPMMGIRNECCAQLTSAMIVRVIEGLPDFYLTMEL